MMSGRVMRMSAMWHGLRLGYSGVVVIIANVVVVFFVIVTS